MKKKSGRTLAGQLVDSLLEQNSRSAAVRREQRLAEGKDIKDDRPEERSLSVVREVDLSKVGDINPASDESVQYPAGLPPAPPDELSTADIDFDLGLAADAPESERESKPESERAFEPEPEPALEPAPAPAPRLVATAPKPAPQDMSTPVTDADDKTFALATGAETVRLKESVEAASPSAKVSEVSQSSIRVGFGYSPRAMGGDVLSQFETLRIAQDRIVQLESEIERLRRDNDELGNAGDLLRRHLDETISKQESFEKKYAEMQAILADEKQVYRTTLSARDKDLQALRSKNEELEARLANDFKRIRVRERELEHRLELMKLESTTLARNKDETILDLKRRIDHLTSDLDNYRVKGQELFKTLDQKQDTMRRVVRALRIALSILEGEDETTPKSD